MKKNLDQKKNDEKLIFELLKVTGLNHCDLEKSFKKLLSPKKTLLDFYLLKGRFPHREEDVFIIHYGFENYYELNRLGLLKN